MKRRISHRLLALPAGIVLLLLGMATMACNLFPGVPATPTLIPTRVTATPTPTQPIPTPLALLPTATATATSTRTLTPTATVTVTGTIPPSATLTATDTATSTPSNTSTSTARPTITLIPSATRTFTPQPIPTLALSPTAVTVTAAVTTAVPPITFTPLPAALLATPTLRPSQTSSFTAAPPPTQQVIVITSTPPPIQPTISPIPGTPVAVAPTTPTFTIPNVVIIPTITFNQIDGTVSINGESLQLPFRNASGQAPADFDISISGRRAFIGFDGRMTIDGATYVGDDKHTRQRFISARWSPDGRWLAYIVQTPDAESGRLPFLQTIDDGVWVLDAGTAGAKPNHVFLNTYIRDSNEYPYRVAVALEWAKDGSGLLITVRTVAGYRTVLAGIQREQNQTFDQIFPGAWLTDSSGWSAVRIESDGSVTLGVQDRRGAFLSLLSGSQVGLWMQNPAQLENGSFAFLAKPTAGGRFEGATGLQLYTYTAGGTPIPVSAALDGELISAEWSPNRRAVLVLLQTNFGVVQRVITLDGTIQEVTFAEGGTARAHWGY
ncbi:MAG: hypothetical protein U0528_05295 [Anaerolineae bacterium]